MAKLMQVSPIDPTRLRHLTEIGAILDRFQEINTRFDTEYQGKLTNAQWRKVKRDLKRIKGLPLFNLETRWEEVIGPLLTLRNIFEYLD